MWREYVRGLIDADEARVSFGVLQAAARHREDDDRRAAQTLLDAAP